MSYLFDPSGWHPIPGHPHHEVDLATGAIRNRRTGRVLKQSVTTGRSRCYMTCRIGRVHRLLMAAHIGRELRRDELVRHRDGNPINNALDNLQLGSAKANSLDRYAHNTAGRTLRNADVHEIRAFLGSKPAAWIADRYGVTPRHVCYIARGERWANLPC